MAIINGGQTAGSLAVAKAEGWDGTGAVLVRVIRCNDATLLDRIVRFNNTQNPIKAWELRAHDPVQKRLIGDFKDIEIDYQVRRSSGRRKASEVHYEKLGPYLSAYYGDPISANKNRADLFDDEAKYRNLFDDKSDVRNLLFVYRLAEAVSAYKDELKNAGSAPELRYFHYSGFPLVLIHLSAEVLRLWIPDGDKMALRRVAFDDSVLLDSAKCIDLLVYL